MEINFADLLKPSLPGLILLWLEVIVVLVMGKILMNRFFPNSAFTRLVNAA